MSTWQATDRGKSGTISYCIKATVVSGHAISLRSTRKNWGATAMAFMASLKFLPWLLRVFRKMRLVIRYVKRVIFWFQTSVFTIPCVDSLLLGLWNFSDALLIRSSLLPTVTLSLLLDVPRTLQLAVTPPLPTWPRHHVRHDESTTSNAHCAQRETFSNTY